MLQSLECVDNMWLSTRWYNYPLPLQRYVQLIMLRMQSPVVLSGFGFVDCTLDTFVAVRILLTAINNHLLHTFHRIQTLKTIGSVITLLQSMEGI